MQTTKQVIVIDADEPTPGQLFERTAFFNEDGTAFLGFVPSGTAADAATTATAIGTAAKTTTSDEPETGTIVPIVFTNGNSANSPTVAFNGGTARAIKLGGTASTGAKLAVAAGGVALFWFDGTDLHQLGTYT